MKVDLYTKAVLTVIAVSLSFIAAGNFIAPAQARSAQTNIAVCSTNNNLCAEIHPQYGLEVWVANYDQLAHEIAWRINR